MKTNISLALLVPCGALLIAAAATACSDDGGDKKVIPRGSVVPEDEDATGATPRPTATLGATAVPTLPIPGASPSVVGTVAGNPNPPPPITAEALSATYAAQCAGCHGDAAGGGFGPALGNTSLTKDAWFTIVAEGKGRMPAFATSGAWDSGVNPSELEADYALFAGAGPVSPSPVPTTSPTTIPTTIPTVATTPTLAPSATPTSMPTVIATPTPPPLPTVIATPSATPTLPPLPTVTPAPTATPGSTPGRPPAPTALSAKFATACAGCHGSEGADGFAPKLAGTGLSYEAFITIVREGSSPMPAIAPARYPDSDAQADWAFLRNQR